MNAPFAPESSLRRVAVPTLADTLDAFAAVLTQVWTSKDYHSTKPEPVLGAPEKNAMSLLLEGDEKVGWDELYKGDPKFRDIYRRVSRAGAKDGFGIKENGEWYMQPNSVSKSAQNAA